MNSDNFENLIKKANELINYMIDYKNYIFDEDA